MLGYQKSATGPLPGSDRWVFRNEIMASEVTCEWADAGAPIYAYPRIMRRAGHTQTLLEITTNVLGVLGSRRRRPGWFRTRRLAGVDPDHGFFHVPGQQQGQGQH